MPDTKFLLPDEPLADLASYQERGGGEGLARALRIGPEQTVSEVHRSKLRGRGGGGFPAGMKWAGVAAAPPGQRRFLVCNAAEGEPGTFKDRALIRSNPYQLLEGMAIAAFAVGAEEAYIGIKDKYRLEMRRLEQAAEEMSAAGMLGEVPLRVVTGPDDYLLGEEKGLLEAIEGRDPFPRLYPPYVLGLHTGMMSGVGAASVGPDDQYNPTVVNNVETLSNVPHILARGEDWFRSIGTADTPGTMVFTVSGDVRHETVAELPMGTPLAVLVYGVGEGLGEGRRLKAAVSGVSNAPLPQRLIDTPLDFGSMEAVGSGLGSGGFIVYDDTACIVEVGAVLSSFLAVESCGQCPPCKMGTSALAQRFARLELGEADPTVLEEMSAWLSRVTDANRCGLGAGERALAAGILREFFDEVADHVGRACPSDRSLRLPKISDFLPEASRFVYDDTYFDWRNP
jgi:NADH:ubiquinone oxidoreductase subunit F (NADH-binding)